LGVFTGVFAFRLAEGNPRTAPPEGETLPELLRWKYGKWKASREHPDAENEGWDEITKAVKEERL